MFGLSITELALVGAIALIVLGPKQLPEVARAVGRLLNEFKRASGDLTSVLVDARDETQKSLLKARDEFNNAIEKASQAPEHHVNQLLQPSNPELAVHTPLNSGTHAEDSATKELIGEPPSEEQTSRPSSDPTGKSDV